MINNNFFENKLQEELEWKDENDVPRRFLRAGNVGAASSQSVVVVLVNLVLVMIGVIGFASVCKKRKDQKKSSLVKEKVNLPKLSELPRTEIDRSEDLGLSVEVKAAQIKAAAMKQRTESLTVLARLARPQSTALSRTGSFFDWNASMRMDSRDDLVMQCKRFSYSSTTDAFGAMLRQWNVEGSSVKGGLNLSRDQVKSYKTLIPKADVERIHKLRQSSVRLSQNMLRINALLGFGKESKLTEIDPKQGEKEDFTHKTKEVVEKVCKGLDIVPRDVVNEATKGKGKVGQALNVDRKNAKNLDDYLVSLVSAMNNWFHEEGEKEIVGLKSLLLSLIYLSRLRKVEEDFQLNEFNVHRLFAVMMLVAAKFSEDEPISNTFWADISGVDVMELGKLEESFCQSNNFNFFVPPDELAALYDEFGLEFVSQNLRLSFNSSVMFSQDESFSSIDHLSVNLDP